MLVVEAALLRLDRVRAGKERVGGVLTPATFGGVELVDRLQRRTGIVFRSAGSLLL